MSGSDYLKASEQTALEHTQFVSNVTGKGVELKTNKKGSFGALGFIVMVICVTAVIFSSGNLIPVAISERLIEQTDVQYADAVESKKLVFQQAMYEGSIPDSTVAVLETYGVQVSNNNGEQTLILDGRTVSAENFIREVSTDVKLYDAFEKATYSRAAYYFDESANKVFDRLGTSRNNFTAESDFGEVMDSLLGSGSSIDVDTVTTIVEDGNVNYVENNSSTNALGGASDFVSAVGKQNLANTTTEATLNSADTLKVADTISKEQRSALFFLGFMENISKMKAGEGNESRINDAMNYLTEVHESEIVDVNTGETITVRGSALESPSFFAIMSNGDFDASKVQNYSSDRILRTVERRLGVNDGRTSIVSTVASSDIDIKGTISRLLSGREGASLEALTVTDKTIDKSLVNNSYETIKGVDAGEFLVEGAVNVGKELAKASGATAGDANAVASYARLNSTVLAMDAAIDRMNRSPFDVTSKNTFLGSIIYNIVTTSGKYASGKFTGIKTLSSITGKSILSLASSSYADAATGYLTNYGECETYATIGAVGTAHCSEVATFDTSTLNDVFNDAGFIEFVNHNTTLSSSGSRTINKNSDLADFIIYNNERITPLGVTDSGILDSLANDTSSVGFMSNIIKMIWSFVGAPEGHKRIATGAAYVNSSSNDDWQKYKYAQRYVSLARATEALRQYSGDATAYNSVKFFEGNNNPVVAFVNDYYASK